MKHFRCRALKKGSRSGIRVVYAYLEDEDRIEFVEVYYKKKDDRDCDRDRILKYYSQLATNYHPFCHRCLAE